MPQGWRAAALLAALLSQAQARGEPAPDEPTPNNTPANRTNRKQTWRRAMLDDFNFAQVGRAMHCARRFDEEENGRPGVLAVLLPKTGSRHFSTILTKEYGKYAQRGCTLVEVHRRPVIKVSLECSQHLVRMRRHYVRHMRRRPEALIVPASKSASVLRREWMQLQALAARRGIRVISIVRDPVDFVLSYFSYTQYTWTNATWRPLLQTILDDPFLHNYQLGLLSGARFFDSLEAHERVEANISFDGRACWGREPVEPLSEEDFHHLRKRVESGDVLLGVVERFEDTVRHFAEELDWDEFDPGEYGNFEPRDADRHRVDKKRRNGDRSRNRLPRSYLSDAEVARIRQLWRLDGLLHDLAKSSLPARGHAAGGAQEEL